MKGIVKLNVVYSVPVDTDDYESDTVVDAGKEIIRHLDDMVYGVEDLAEFAESASYVGWEESKSD